MEPAQGGPRPTNARHIDVPLGRIMITPAAQAVLTQEEVLTALNRHRTGDWGEVGADDKSENDLSLKEGFRLLSAYRSAQGETFWIISEADRKHTTLLLPSDY
jgi:hypothetical protein